jgi:hypothetical protein
MFMMVPLKGVTSLDTGRFTYSPQRISNLYDKKRRHGMSSQYQDPLDVDIDIGRIVNGRLQVVPKEHWMKSGEIGYAPKHHQRSGWFLAVTRSIS